jgi:hypothetical protein
MMLYLKPLGLSCLSVGVGIIAAKLPFFSGNWFLTVAVIGLVSPPTYAAFVLLAAPEVGQEFQARFAGALPAPIRRWLPKKT